MTTDRVLDRRVSYDEKSRAFPAVALPRLQAKVPRSYTWGLYAQLDQGSEGACVGFGWAHELAARPAIVTNITNDVGRLIYHDAQRVDEWPGEAYEGTSVLAGAKTVQARGFMQSYHWCFSLDELVLAVGYQGPVVMGTWWNEGMFDTDDDGRFTDAQVTSDHAGGHCWLVRGVSLKRSEFLCRNSWGPDWGLYGDFRLTFSQMDHLLHDQGEACVPEGRDKVGTLV